MADQQASSQERTERATPRKRQKAKEEGQVPRGPELSAAFVVLSGTGALAMIGGTSIAQHLVQLLRETAQTLSAGTMTTTGATAMLQGVGLTSLTAMAPFMAGVMVVVFLVNLIRARGVLSWQPVQPKWSNMSPLSGVKRIVGSDAVANLVKALFKFTVLGTVTYMIIESQWDQLTSLAELEPAGSFQVFRTLAIRLATVTGLAFLVLAAGDYGYQIYKHEKSLRMTRNEVIREHRETEGDPLVKARMLTIARTRARLRMLQQVPTADVVVVNPTHVAVALKYDMTSALAPVVVAMGERKLAERIKKIARESGVAIVENPPVARALLATATVGEPIPPALYMAVAELLAFVYRRRGTAPALASGSGNQ